MFHYKPELAELSQQTTTPIRYVPLIIFYINGTPLRSLVEIIQKII